MEKLFIYPAVFEYEGNKISLHFPDIDEAYSCADSIDQAYQYAKEVLKLSIKGRIKDNEDIPKPTEPKDIKLQENQFMSLIEVAVVPKIQYDKKTLTIPHDVNVAATKAGINFSQVLQKALLHELDNM